MNFSLGVSKNIKKILSMIIVILIYTSLSAGLIEVYKRGEIRITEDPEFGTQVNWDNLLYAGIRDITFAPDGSFFISARKQHKIYKFSKDGRFLTEFGQKGEGAGDLRWPGELSILDNKHLIVAEFALHRRISIFDLKGKFVRLVRTANPVFGVIGLKSNKLAILSQSYIDRPGNVNDGTIKVYIKSTQIGQEKKIFSLKDWFAFGQHKNTIFGLPFVLRKVFIEKTRDGNLLVGHNYSNVITIYSPDGKKTMAFKLDLPAIKVTRKIISQHKKNFIETSAKRKWNTKRQLTELADFSDYEKFFGENLPYFSGLKIDEEGNILVLHYTCGIDSSIARFQVYSPGGKFACETKINFTGYLHPFIDGDLLKKMVIRRDGLYALLELESEDGDESFKQLIRTKFDQK